MSQVSSEYTLYYWSVMGRGHFVRILFEEAGVKYTEINDEKEIVKRLYFKGKNEIIGYPTFAPPILKHGNYFLGQTNTIVRYLATKFNLLPKNESDKFYSDQIMGNIQDIFFDMAKASKRDF